MDFDFNYSYQNIDYNYATDDVLSDKYVAITNLNLHNFFSGIRFTNNSRSVCFKLAIGYTNSMAPKGEIIFGNKSDTDVYVISGKNIGYLNYLTEVGVNIKIYKNLRLNAYANINSSIKTLDRQIYFVNKVLKNRYQINDIKEVPVMFNFGVGFYYKMNDYRIFKRKKES